jgi:hypothetical protein
MQDRILYIELKTGFDIDKGPARITRVSFSKSGRTVYFHGRSLRHWRSFDANHVDVETGETFWISGPERDRTDRRSSNVPVEIDPEIAHAYQAFLDRAPLSLGSEEESDHEAG